MEPTTSQRILVMGAGGIGGTITGYLTEVGADVTAVTTNETIAAAVREHGFRLSGDGNPRAVPGRIELGVPAGATYDLVLLATQPPHVEEAARTAAPHLAPAGNMVVLQNGLCEPRIAAIAGDHRVVGGIVAWGASMPEPGRYDRTSSGGFVLGRMGRAPDDAVSAIAQLLEVIGPVGTTENLSGARWSKLAINCMISSMGTIGGDRLGPIARVRRYRRLGLEIISEVVAVARAAGVALEKVAGTLDLDWLALTPGDRARTASASLAAKHAMLLGVGLRYRRLRSSMLSAIERGREPAIDFLNGEVVTRARTLGVATPVNERVVDTVHRIARGEYTSSRQLLDRLIYNVADSTTPDKIAKPS